jgi:signal transduction histidine kinase
MLQRLNDAYSSQLRFVSDASHELRTPIAVIQGYANLLDRWGKEDEETLQEAIDAIKGEAENMKELMEQLLFLARSDNNTIPMDISEINLTMLVKEVCSESRMIDKRHSIIEDIVNGVIIRGDSQLVKQAIRIIVDNSIKYTPEDGGIKLRVYIDGGYARVAVTDEGIGISQKDLSKVFDRFSRADSSRARQTGGTGLGLSIANWIVDAHKGFIEVTSRENIGTRMTLCFPLK